jgi:hypothetical protein
MQTVKKKKIYLFFPRFGYENYFAERGAQIRVEEIECEA